jgi:hypothetical protein
VENLLRKIWVIGSTFYNENPTKQNEDGTNNGPNNKCPNSYLKSNLNWGNCIYMVGVDGQSEG